MAILANVPDKWLDILTKDPAPPAQSNGSLPSLSRLSYRDLLMQSATRYLASAGGRVEGERNKNAYNLAGHIKSFVCQGERLSEDDTYGLLAGCWNPKCSPPIHSEELRRAVHSAYQDNGTPRPDKEVLPVNDILSRLKFGATPAETIIEPGRQITYQRITSAELMTGDYQLEYAIQNAMVEGQPLLIVGPQKVLKTSITVDSSISLASGGMFLGLLKVKRRYRVAVMSGESGLATLQETAKRIGHAAGVDVASLDNLLWTTDLPRFGDPRHIQALEEFITADRIEILFIDPAFLSMPGGDAGNLMIQGALLRSVSEVCQAHGVTLVLNHHTKRGTGRSPFDVPELSDIAWAGFSEFARQWWLLGRRERYEPGTGEHKLWLSIGGSAGHSNLLALDISEGVRSDPGGRRWDLNVYSGSEIHDRDRQEKARQKEQDTEARTRTDSYGILAALERLGGKETLTAIRERTNLRGARLNKAIDLLLETSAIKPCEIQKTNRKTPYEGFKICDQDIGNMPL